MLIRIGPRCRIERTVSNRNGGARREGLKTVSAARLLFEEPVVNSQLIDIAASLLIVENVGLALWSVRAEFLFRHLDFIPEEPWNASVGMKPIIARMRCTGLYVGFPEPTPAVWTVLKGFWFGRHCD